MRLRKPILVDSVATALKEIFVHVLLFSQAHVKSAPTERSVDHIFFGLHVQYLLCLDLSYHST